MKTRQTPHCHLTSVNYSGQHSGPRLIILGAVHGNETCGTEAIRRLIEQLDGGQLTVKAGSLTLVAVSNPLAFARGERNGERNLNRDLRPRTHPYQFEDHAGNWLCCLLAQHDVLLDIHSTNAPCAPFVLLGPRNNHGALEPFAHETEERLLARHLGVQRCVDGWFSTYAEGVERRMASTRDNFDVSEKEALMRYAIGTTEYMRAIGGYGLTLECGQHGTVLATEVASRAIMHTLGFLGLIEDKALQPKAQAMQAYSMVEVHDRLAPGDVFSRDWASFDRVRQGDEIARRSDQSIVSAAFDGLILFPDNKAAVGEEWFYLARANPDF